ncbi:MAG TPA: alpha/beta hydrolase [Acidimicrobiia bacterium]|nr:alpha/beta hydrolase [Acidimicrobiia bacterium]
MRTRTAASALVGLLLVVGACGSDDAATSSASTTVAASTSPSTSPPPSTTAATTTTAVPTGPPATTNVLYHEDRFRQIVDVHLPAGEGPHPTILAIHGGAFSTNSKTLYRHFAEYFTTRGVALVATNYRFVPESTYPAQVEDVQCALAWLHANAEGYGFDPERVVVLGGSAGGYLTAMLGTVEDRDLFAGDCPHPLPEDPVAGAVVFYGFFDFRTLDDWPFSQVESLQRMWGTTHDQLSSEQLDEMSPIAWVDGSEPPFLLIHGVEDSTIPSVMSERFHAALSAAGAPSELILIEGTGHAFERQPTDSPANARSLAAIERFIEGLG